MPLTKDLVELAADGAAAVTFNAVELDELGETALFHAGQGVFLSVHQPVKSCGGDKRALECCNGLGHMIIGEGVRVSGKGPGKGAGYPSIFRSRSTTSSPDLIAISTGLRIGPLACSARDGARPSRTGLSGIPRL